MVHSSKQVAGILEVHGEFKLHSRTYRGTETFEALTLGLPPNSWVWLSIKRVAKMSKTRPRSTTDMQALKRLLTNLATDQEWRRHAATSRRAMTVQVALDAFKQIEDNLAGASLSDDTRKRWSAVLRSCLTDYLRSTDFAHADRLATLFRTRFKSPTRPGRLISDLGANESDYVDGFPLGATPHRTVKELRESMHEKISRDLDSIKAKCIAALDEHEHIASKVLAIFDRPCPEELIKKIANYCIGKQIDSIPKWVLEIPIDQLVSAYYQISHNERYWPVGKKASVCFLRVKEINQWIEREAGITNSLLENYFYDIHFGSYATRIATQILLAEHTGWNGSSIVSLNERCISGKSPPLEIQSFKSKTDDHTPISVLEASDVDALRAIQHLQDRLFWLKKLRLVGAKEIRFWINHGPLLRGSKPPKEYVSFGSDLKKFQKRYALPSFAINQIRRQVLAKISVETGGLDAARRKAGHGSIRVTGEYLDQLLLHRMNSSINLEYQKKLESSIVYEAELTSTGGAREQSKSLLYPIGDGATCANPADPPELSYLSAGVCTAKTCHIGGGCRNRELRVTSSRIEEAIRTETYYIENWERLLSENPDKFFEYSLPAMLFSIAFTGALRLGPYAHVVSRIETQVRGGANAKQH